MAKNTVFDCIDNEATIQALHFSYAQQNKVTNSNTNFKSETDLVCFYYPRQIIMLMGQVLVWITSLAYVLEHPFEIPLVLSEYFWGHDFKFRR